MARILLVDDERLFVKGLKRSLEEAGYEVLTAFDGEEALTVLEGTAVDLVLLDVMLPKIDGLEVCRQLRREKETPVIMLTAKGDDVDKIVGLELGADDYVAKPFNTRELIARIRAVLRRAVRHEAAGADPGCLRLGRLEIDRHCRAVTLAGQNIELTGREFDLLLALAAHPGRVWTREMLLEQVWGERYYGEARTVDVHIRRLREKLEADPAAPRIIVTKWGVGYFFRVPE